MPTSYLDLVSTPAACLFTIQPTAGVIFACCADLDPGSLLLVPMYRKFGRRPVMLFSMLCYCAGLIGASQANSYGGLMAARIIHAFGSGVCEALPVQLVNDIFFLHERGQRLGYCEWTS